MVFFLARTLLRLGGVALKFILFVLFERTNQPWPRGLCGTSGSICQRNNLYVVINLA